MPRYPKTWLVLGTGPSAARFVDAALDQCQAVITTNSGWELLATSPQLPLWLGPDADVAGTLAYFLSDAVACRRYQRTAALCRRLGVRVVSLAREADSLEQRGLSPSDTLIPLVHGQAYRRGQHADVSLSGLHCLQYACNQDPACVVLVGHEGYSSSPSKRVVDCWDGLTLGPEHGLAKTYGVIQPFMASVMRARPDIRFVVCGKPHWELPLGTYNHWLVETPEDLAAQMSRLRHMPGPQGGTP